MGRLRHLRRRPEHPAHGARPARGHARRLSLGGGEVARYLSTYGSERVEKAVFAVAVPPILHKTEGNPDGGLDDATVQGFLDGATSNRIAFLDGFATGFFSADGELKVSEPQRQHAVDIASLTSPKGTLECVKAFACTDRDDLAKIDVPVLVLHGDSDGVVPCEVSGKRTAETVPGAQPVLVPGAPHGFNASHAREFNDALLDFLAP